MSKTPWFDRIFYAVVGFAVAALVVAFFVGIFFLKTYRWGSCS